MLGLLVLAALPLITVYLYNKAYYKRFVQYASIPQLPSSLVWGHLQTFDALNKRGPRDRHPDSVFAEMLATLGKPPLMFVDLRPVNRPVVLVTSHEIAEQISRPSALFPTSVPKANLSYLNHVIGTTSILSADGDRWKHLRKRFNPGFAPQHLLTHLPAIIDKTSLFLNHLDNLARTGAETAMLPLLANLTFDIIGVVAMGVHLDAQRVDRQGEIIKLFSELLGSYLDDKADYPWWMIPRVELRRYRLGKRIDKLIRDIVQEKYNEYQRSPDDKSRSILSLSFQDTESFTPEMLHTTSDQLKSFLLAGHDTTSTTLSWVFYDLMRTPRALKAVRDEVRSVLGPDTDPDSVRRRLLAAPGPDLINQMPYMNAVIKESLRMHGPASTARTPAFGSSLTVSTPDGRSHCLDGVIIYNCQSMIHRDPALYGATADIFRPERWLAGPDSASSSKVPASAWRPFERGPRNCIGQEFANIEARVIISLVVLKYDFIKVGLGELALGDDGKPVLEDTDQLKVKPDLYLVRNTHYTFHPTLGLSDADPIQTRQITIKPVDGMKMRVKFAAPKV